MNLPLAPLILAALVLLATLPATGLVLRWLQRRAVLDRPNERSSHTRPTPRGGGIATTLVLVLAILGWGIWSWPQAWEVGLVLAGGMLGLGLVSFLDDLRSLPAGPRLLAQGLAVAAGLGGVFWSGDSGLPIQPFFVEPLGGLVLIGLGISWLWFINLYNFMDGIDGITGVESLSIGLGLAGCIWLGFGGGDDSSVQMPGYVAALSLAAGAAGLGFLYWNWHPARIFLGDVGSIPLGYLLGFLLLCLALSGQWIAAVLLPLYYLLDATLTLGRRLVRGEKIWQAHRSHAYQRAVRMGRSHAAVSRWILGVNGLLAGLALASVWLARMEGSGWGQAAILGAGLLLVAGFLWFLPRPSQRHRHEEA